MRHRTDKLGALAELLKLPLAYNRDHRAENAGGSQIPILNVFVRDGGGSARRTSL